MRLVDKLASQGSAEISRLLRDQPPVVFVIDEIVLHSSNTMPALGTKMIFPMPLLPGIDALLSGTNPRRSRQSIAGLITMTRRSTARWCIGGTRQDFHDRQFHSAVALLDAASRTSACRIVRMKHYAFLQGRCQEWDAFTVWLLDQNGYVLGLSYTGSSCQAVICKLGKDAADSSFRQVSHAIALAFTFANCSNVKLYDVSADLEPTGKFRQRLKLPRFERYTLEIEEHIARPRREPSDSGETGVMPFHLCRGHFAEYTAERPMFGNPKNVSLLDFAAHARS